jgi:anti-sigma regulatory factor (Ser/Thr protein kinase)
MRMTVEDRDQRECLPRKASELARLTRCQAIMRLTELTLASLPDAPSCGRLLVQRYLSAWGIAHIIDEAQLVMSELLTNAVKASAEFTTIQIRLAVLGDTSLLIEVQDCNPEPPILKDASGDNESGRGLMIVDALCERWGYYHPAHGSKAVWAELLIPLPTREPEQLEMPPVAVMDDPRVLRRVHTELKNLQVRGDGSAAQQVWTQGEIHQYG